MVSRQRASMTAVIPTWSFLTSAKLLIPSLTNAFYLFFKTEFLWYPGQIIRPDLSLSHQPHLSGINQRNTHLSQTCWHRSTPGLSPGPSTIPTLYPPHYRLQYLPHAPFLHTTVSSTEKSKNNKIIWHFNTILIIYANGRPLATELSYH